MERISIAQLSRDTKILLLKELGYSVEGDFVIKDGKRHTDIYVGKEVTLSNMLIFPGSILVLDNNELSVAEYLEDHPNIDL